MSLDETYVKQTGCRIVADDKFTLFDFGVVGVWENSGARVGEYGDRGGEPDAMLASVGRGFALIPLEVHVQ